MDNGRENTGKVNSGENNPVKPKNNGGLYSKVKMSVRTANILIAALIAILIAVTLFLVSHNGFTVKFDTDGGSYVQSVKAYHSELVAKPEEPVKEGYTFDGWYTDRSCTNEWDMSSDTVTQSMTLYAGWIKNN